MIFLDKPIKPKTASSLPAKSALLLAIFTVLFTVLFAGVAYAVAPTAVNDNRTIPINSSITLNVIANDFDADGDAISVVSVAASNNAAVVLNSDGSIFYTPRKDFLGVDTFTYTIQDSGAATAALVATGTVTITVVSSNFVGAAAGENNRSLALAMDIACTGLRDSSDGALNDGQRNLLARCNALDTLAVNDPALANAAFNQIAPEETIALMRVTSESSRTQTAAVSQRVGQLQAGNNRFTFNGLAANNHPSNNHPSNQQTSGGAAGDTETIASALGFFASVQHEAAKRDVTALESGYKSSGNAFTLGADYRMSNPWVVGAALGLSQNDLDYSAQNGSLNSDVTSIIVFSAYTMDRSSLETQIGYANTAFDSIRQVEYDEGGTMLTDILRGSTGGSQLLFNAQWQWEWNKNALTIFPFVRFDYLQNNVNGYGENGTSGLQMQIDEQSTEQFTLGVGVQSTYVFNQSWGVFIPLAKLTLLSEISSGFDPVTSRFAYDLDPNNTFDLQNDGEDTAFSQLALGSSFIFKGGVSSFVQYQQLVGYDNLSAYQIQAGIRYEF